MCCLNSAVPESLHANLDIIIMKWLLTNSGSTDCERKCSWSGNFVQIVRQVPQIVNENALGQEILSKSLGKQYSQRLSLKSFSEILLLFFVLKIVAELFYW